jgi:heat shock protein HslJ
VRLVVAPLAALLVLVAAGGCGGDDESSADASSVEGVPWVLISGVDVEGWEDAPPSITFEEGTASGSTGCNQWTGDYTFDGESLELGELAMTAMACPPPADEVERAVVDALEQVAGWRLEDEELVLVDGDDTELLRFVRASPAGAWEATGVLQDDALASPLEGTAITATFGEDGELSGSGGCNTYNARYTIDGGELEIGPAASTKMLCPEPEGVMEQETAYFAALEEAVAFRVQGGVLELLGPEGSAVVTYVRGADELASLEARIAELEQQLEDALADSGDATADAQEMLDAAREKYEAVSGELGATSRQLADSQAELERRAAALTSAEAARSEAERAAGAAQSQAEQAAARADAAAARADAEAARADLAEACLAAVADVLRRLYDSDDIADGLEQAAEELEQIAADC